MFLNSIKTVLLLAFLAGLFIGVGALFGPVGAIIGLVLAVVINFGSFWFSDKIVLKMYKAKEVHKGHELYDITHNLVRKAKIPMPKVYIIDTPTPNAFATGRSPKSAAVAANQGLLDMLSKEEVEGVMAHELSHVKHRDTLIQTIAVGIATSIAFVAEMFQWAAIFGFGADDEEGGYGGLIGMIALAILTPIIAMIIQMAISRQREFMADEGATRMLKTPMPLINALQKLESYSSKVQSNPSPSKAPTESLFIVNPFKAGGLAGLFSTHPSTKDRIHRMKQIKLHR